MGVRGLTTFVYENKEAVFQTDFIHDTPLVIDGNNLMIYLLRYKSTPMPRMAQEYASASAVTHHFIEELRYCNITPYILFDGPFTVQKRDAVLASLDGNVKALEGMFHTNDPELTSKRLVPPFTQDCIVQDLVELEVPFAFSLFDADAELAALANKLECPVLAEDSDFLIFDLKQGYLPLSHFKWRGNKTKTQRREIHCLRYKTCDFSSEYGISATKLPFLAMALGNDWVPTEIFTEKVFSLSRKYGVNKRSFTWRVESVIQWLAPISRKCDEYILTILQDSLAYANKEENVQKVRSCLDLYRNLPDISEVWKTLQNWNNPLCEKQQNVEFAIRNGLVHFSAYHLVTENFVGLPTAGVCDTQKPSPHMPSIEIRYFAYRMLLRRFCLALEGPQALVVGEYDMADVSYKKVRGWHIYTANCPLCQRHHLMDEPCKDLPCEKFQTDFIICKFLGGKVDFQTSFSSFCEKEIEGAFDSGATDYCSRLDLVMLSSLYWLEKTKPKPVYVISLLLNFTMFIQIYLNRRKRQANAQDTVAFANDDSQVKSPPSALPSAPKLENEVVTPQKEGKGENQEAAAPACEAAEAPKETIFLGPAWYKRETPEHKIGHLKKDPPKQDPLSVETTDNPGSLNAGTGEQHFDMPIMKRIIKTKFCTLWDLLGPPPPVSVLPNLAFSQWVLLDDFPVDMDLLHSGAKWQYCVWAVAMLHQSVKYDGLHIGIQDIFGSNIVLHETSTRLHKSEGIEKEAMEDLRLLCSATTNLLETKPWHRNMLKVMVDYLLQGQ